jgi:hypothetical protein
MAGEELVVGKRVWVSDPNAATGSSFGRIANVDEPGDLRDGTGFIVSVESNNRLLACRAEGRGVTWDFAEPPTTP